MQALDLRPDVVVDGLLGDGPPFLAQLSVERHHVDVFGHPRMITLDAAGCALNAVSATTRCWAEMVERLVASSPATVRRTVLEADDAPPYDHLPWWMFSSYDVDVAGRLTDEAPLDGQFVCIARGLRSRRLALVPASRVVLHWSEFVGDQGVAGECDSTGLAAGRDVEDASLRALREVLERDAIMHAWRDITWPRRRVDAAVLGETMAAWLATVSYGLRLIDVARPRLDPVVVALLYDHHGATVGTACRETLGDAAEAAVLEAAMLRSTIDVVGAGTPGEPIELSLDHVRFGYRHADVLHRWVDHFEGHRPDPSGRTGSLVDRVSAAFGDEPVMVELADEAQAPFAVVRVLLPGAMRKEWRHDLRRRSCSRASGAVHGRCHDLPHPFG